MGRGRGLLVAAVIVVGAGGLAALLVSLAPEPERRDPPSTVPYVATATVIAGTGSIPVFGAGTVRPGAEIDIAPQVGGRVVWVNPAFQSGRRVEAGATLFRIEEEDYVYRLREAEAMLAAREAEFLEAFEEAAVARSEYERYAARQQEAVDEASPLTLREPQLNAAKAALERDKAKVAAAALALSRTQVRAPFDGFVRTETVDQGQLVSANQAVGRLFAADAVEVVVPVSDADAVLIPNLWGPREVNGEGAAVHVIAEYGESRFAWRGHVDRAEASLDHRTRTIDIIVRVPDPFRRGDETARESGDPPLLVGKFVEVQIQGTAPTSYFRVPRAALQPGNEVWAVGDGGTLRIVPVQVLQRANDEAYVTGLLAAGQPVVIGGIPFATDGMAVRTGAPRAR
ncbi:MAG: efflux RND transporter periplasmic adaptor subunit [Gammaproteobacteria bacterium]|nr:efflux RND transporter periplasmic adaptor subunit [Gammaproteobacteria bacterium]